MTNTVSSGSLIRKAKAQTARYEANFPTLIPPRSGQMNLPIKAVPTPRLKASEMALAVRILFDRRRVENYEPDGLQYYSHGEKP